VATHFGDSAGESTTSSTSNIKGGNSDKNGSDLDKSNILKPTFDTLMGEGSKAFEAYHVNLEVHFLLCCEVTWHGTILQNTTLIVFNKTEVIPDVLSDPSPSHNDIQAMINYALERQAKNTDELLRRLVEKRNGKKLDTTSVNLSSSTCVVSFTQTNPHTSGTLAGGTSMPNPSAQLVNHFHSRTTIEGSAPTFEVS
jgi:ssRNA-specific RNase YbeY (16S rRNA maturation enzyme)